MNYRERVEVWSGEEMLGTAVFVGRAEKKGVLWGWSGQLAQCDFEPSKMEIAAKYDLKFGDGETRKIQVMKLNIPGKGLGGKHGAPEPVIRVKGEGEPPSV